MAILTRNLTDLITRPLRALFRAISRVAPDARRVIRKPAVLAEVLLRAHRAQLSLVVSVLFLLLVAPPIVDFATSKVFPPKTSKKLFGLIKKQKQDPARQRADSVITTVLWLTSGSVVILLFWLSIPGGGARATALSRRRIAEAEDVQETDPRKSLALYKQALALTTDPEQVPALKTRIHELEPASAPHQSHRKTVADTGRGTLYDNDSSGPVSSATLTGPNTLSRVGHEGRYSLGEELGRGAMGVVYRCHDNVLDRTVAVKQLSVQLVGDDQYASRFRREAKALARITHPNIVQVYDFIESEGRLWMVLEFVDGGDLAAHLQSGGRLSIREALKIVVSAARGLAYAHNQGVIHRDLKPANILLTGELEPKISDFGIAKLTQSSGITQIGSVLGSPPYMSPEQCSGGPVDARTDIYALGITLYELVTGHVPFDGDTSSVLARHIVEQPRRPADIIPGISQDIEDVVLGMLAKKPDQRPQDMSTVIDLLESCCSSSPVTQG